MERKARTDPKAFARTPAEEDRADAATQCLRYIADDNSSRYCAAWYSRTC